MAHQLSSRSSQPEKQNSEELEEELSNTESQEAGRAQDPGDEFENESGKSIKFGGDHKQSKTKRMLKTLQSHAPLFDPELSWEFDLSAVPKDRNISDYVFGLIELSRVLRKLPIAPTKLNDWPLIYTKAGKPRADRVRGGRPFLDPDGKAIGFQDTFLDGKQHALEKSDYVISMLPKHKEYFKLWIGGLGLRRQYGEQAESSENTKDVISQSAPKQQKRASSSQNQSHPRKRHQHEAQRITEITSDSDNSLSSIEQIKFTPKKASAVTDDDFFKLKQDNAMLKAQTNLLQEELDKLKAAEKDDKQKMVRAMIERATKATLQTITSAVVEAGELAIEAVRRSDNGGDYVLAMTEHRLRKELKKVEKLRKL